jgi:hypothetical protein
VSERDYKEVSQMRRQVVLTAIALSMATGDCFAEGTGAAKGVISGPSGQSLPLPPPQIAPTIGGSLGGVAGGIIGRSSVENGDDESDDDKSAVGRFARLSHFKQYDFIRELARQKKVEDLRAILSHSSFCRVSRRGTTLRDSGTT